jgi:phosphohistidine phosphatase
MAGKELFLVRHAKSSWDDSTISDHDRPLNERGLRNAPDMGSRLSDREVSPDALISSTALRGRTTAEIMAVSLNFPKDRIVLDRALYHASATELQEYIGGLDDSHFSVMLFGHNPGMTSLVSHLFGLALDNLPTCGVVHLNFSVESWAEASRSMPCEATIDFPKNTTGSPIKIV